jgi:hypothetical protein
MKRLAVALGLLAFGLSAAGPARADFAVVRSETGYCQIWWDSAPNPWGAGWTKIAAGLPDYAAARAVLANAMAQRVCL